MTQIIPAIIAKNYEELEEKIKLIKPYSEWVQLDVMDGKFVPNKTFSHARKIKEIKNGLKLEVHLMVNNPLSAIGRWLENGAERVIVHWESLGPNPQKQFFKIHKKVKSFKKELGLALNPKTSFREVVEYVPKADMVLLMAVNPGFGGQKFLKSVLKKIKNINKLFPSLKIEVDGGINPQTARKCAMAGAGILVSGSYVFSGEIKERLKKLENTP